MCSPAAVVSSSSSPLWSLGSGVPEGSPSGPCWSQSWGAGPDWTVDEKLGSFKLLLSHKRTMDSWILRSWQENLSIVMGLLQDRGKTFHPATYKRREVQLALDCDALEGANKIRII